MLIPLKLKYRVFRAYKFGTYRNRTGNSHGGNKQRLTQGYGIRRRSYYTHIAR